MKKEFSLAGFFDDEREIGEKHGADGLDQSAHSGTGIVVSRGTDEGHEAVVSIEKYLEKRPSASNLVRSYGISPLSILETGLGSGVSVLSAGFGRPVKGESSMSLFTTPFCDRKVFDDRIGLSIASSVEF